jgi:hypothetical protein
MKIISSTLMQLTCKIITDSRLHVIQNEESRCSDVRCTSGFWIKTLDDDVSWRKINSLSSLQITITIRGNNLIVGLTVKSTINKVLSFWGWIYSMNNCDGSVLKKLQFNTFCTWMVLSKQAT